MHATQNRPRGYTYGSPELTVPPLVCQQNWPTGFWRDVAPPPQRIHSTSPEPPTPLDVRGNFDFADASDTSYASPSPPRASYCVPCGPSAIGGVNAFKPRQFLAPHKDAEAAAESEGEEVYTYRSRLDDGRREQRLQEVRQREMWQKTMPTMMDMTSNFLREAHTWELRKTRSATNIWEMEQQSRHIVPVTEVFDAPPEPQYAQDSDEEPATEAQAGVFCEEIVASPCGIEEELEDFTELYGCYDNSSHQSFALEDDVVVRADSPHRGVEDLADCGGRVHGFGSDGSTTPPLSESGTASTFVVEEDGLADGRFFTPPLGCFSIYECPNPKEAKYRELLETLVRACCSGQA